MKKFKVIEKSRFLADNKLSDIKGGATKLCDAINSYRSCGILGISFTSCGTGFTGYANGPDGELCGGQGISFKESNCAGIGMFTTTCDGSNMYTN